MPLLLCFALAAAADQPALPRVLVMIAEQNVGQPSAKFWWGGKTFAMDLEVAENAIAEQLRAAGYTVVDRKLLEGKVQATAAIASADPSDAAIKEFAATSGAEVVFVGKAIAIDAGKVMDTPMHSLQATISMRALSLDDARILASTSTTQVAAHVDALTGGAKALQKTATKATGEMLPKITEALRGKHVRVLLTIRKLKDFKQLRALEAKLRAVADVVNVTERKFENKVAELEVEYTGLASALANKLEAVPLTITGATANTLATEAP